MKKGRIYIVTLILFVTAAGFIVLRYKNKEASAYALLDRNGPSAQTREWTITRNYAASLAQSLKNNPGDPKASLALAALFIQESRVTGNHVYYDKAALKYVNDVLKKDSTNFNALTYKALLYLSQHHFADGLAIAQQAQKVNPYNAFIYGLLVDGYTEMGWYDSAVSCTDHMMSIRPDIRSYSRVSYQREIHGDYPGAIDAMKMAVDAGAPGDEGTEWTRIQLGHLYENTGDLKSAEMYYRIALDDRAGYAPAYGGLARLALAAKNYPEAIGYYLKADSLLNDYSIKEELSDAYRIAGQAGNADRYARLVIDGLSKDAQSGQNDENIGHYADRELAYAWLKTGNYDKALEHAMLEYNRRPENIDVNETVAWVCYNKGEYAQALPYLTMALRTGTRNPVVLCHAGLIYAANGNKEAARLSFRQAMGSGSGYGTGRGSGTGSVSGSGPNIPAALKDQCQQVLKTL
jgi:tetratricopeptide (TPR) repeat protein